MAKIQMETPIGLCPVQAYGTVDGAQVYFRARYDEWTLTIAEQDAVAALLGETPRLYQREAQYGEGEFDAGYMEREVAMDFIERCFYEYLTGMRGTFKGNPGYLPEKTFVRIEWGD